MMTQAERLRHLSGTGWGKVLEKPDQVLDIPFFMKTEYNRIEEWNQHNEEARIGAAIGAERRKVHKADQRSRNTKACLLLVSFIVSLLIIAGVVS